VGEKGKILDGWVGWGTGKISESQLKRKVKFRSAKNPVLHYWKR